MGALVAFLLKIGLRGIVDRGIDHLSRRAELENDAERYRTMATVEMAREVVKETKIMADYNTQKLGFRWFWVLISLFIFPLALWWTAVLMDSIPYLRNIFGDEQVSNLPTPEIREWAGDMIRWLFYVGSTSAGAVGTAAGIRAVLR